MNQNEHPPEPPRSVADQSPPLRLAARGIVKRYQAVTAVDGADIDVRAGEVMALMGDNGAGKSTLVKCIAGVERPDAGAIWLDGEPLTGGDPNEALARGIETVYQDLALVNPMTAVQNVYLGRELKQRALPGRWLGLTDLKAMHREAAAMLAELGANIPDLNREVTDLSGGQRQALAIARAMLWGRRLVILDEPTAALGVEESRHVLDCIVRLREMGAGVIMISHNLDHVWKVADRVTVLRRGRTRGVCAVAHSHPDEIVGLITGSDAVTARPDAHAAS